MLTRAGLVVGVALIGCRPKDHPPTVRVVSPDDGATFTHLEEVDLVAEFADEDDDIATLRWVDADEGLLSNTGAVPPTGAYRLSEPRPIGVHEVRVEVEDLEGNVASDVVHFEVVEAVQRPVATITAPDDDADTWLAEPLTLAGEVVDPDGPASALVVWWLVHDVAGDVVWSEPAAVDAQGRATGTWTPQVAGRFDLVLDVTDVDGFAAQDDAGVWVRDPFVADQDGDGATPRDGDCDDADPLRGPNAAELCDGADQDCDGVVDDRDGDADDHVDLACAATYPGPLPADDCDDADASAFLGAVEVVDGVDQDCDGAIDDGTPAYDADGDCFCPVAPCSDSAGACATLLGGDCDDADVDRFPTNPERCDLQDQNCDGVPDDGLGGDLRWTDGDGDGFGDASSVGDYVCGEAPGYADNASDCDDALADVNPDGAEVDCNGRDDDCDPTTGDVDGDGDGWWSCDDCDDAEPDVNPDVPEAQCDGVDQDCSLATPDRVDNDHDGVPNCLDCDDTDPLRRPGLAEFCDGVDNDCDADVDEEITYRDAWPDLDGDGHGETGGAAESVCEPDPLDRAFDDGDCDDDDPDVFPGQIELCDGLDQDCDGDADEALLYVAWRPDVDGDGAGDASTPPIPTCDGPPPGDWVADARDCDDTDPDVNIDASEVPCDGVDNDCLRATEDDQDLDRDGVGVCGDCDDADPRATPGEVEVCDGVDNDCDGLPDNGLPTASYWVDLDRDGVGDAGSAPTVSCAPIPGAVSVGGDCDDDDAFVAPGLAEIGCNGVDDDCAGATIDDVDGDSDGFTACEDCDDGDPGTFPGAPELCDGVDNDCDGAVVDEHPPFVRWFADLDGDGHGDAGSPVDRCEAAMPPGVAAVDDDCDDADPLAYPGAPELCDGVNNDCDGGVDEVADLAPIWPDLDSDGLGDAAAAPASSCARPGAQQAAQGGDCDDGDPLVGEGALTWPDVDGDGHGDRDVVGAPTCGAVPGGRSAVGDDCDDIVATVFPGASDPQTASFSDEDCDGYDGSIADAVLVAPDGSDVGNDLCSGTFPCRTVDHAVDVADAVGATQVWLAAGEYAGGATIPRSIDLVGGFDADWVRGPVSAPGHEVVLTGGWFVDDEEFQTVRVRGGSVRLLDLRVVGPDAVGVRADGSGAGTYAVHAAAGTSVTVERCVVEAGAAAPGDDGADGVDAFESASPLAAGGLGKPGASDDVCDTTGAASGNGGVNPVCPDTAGGDGGRGGKADAVCCDGGCDETCGVCSPQRGGSGLDGDGAWRAGACVTWVQTLDASLAPTSDVVEVDRSHDIDRTASDLAATPDGFALAWVHKTGTTTDWWSRLDVGVWTDPPPAEPAYVRVIGAGKILRPSVSADSTGRLLVAWTDYRSEDVGTVWSQAFDAAGLPLSGARALTPPSGRSEVVAGEFLDDERVVLAWEQPFADDRDGIWIQVFSFPDHEPLTAPIAVSLVGYYSERPALAVRPIADGDYEVAVSWEQSQVLDGSRVVLGAVVTID